MMNRRFSKGMTILETSIALAVVAIAIVGILSVLYHASRFSMLARNRVKANQIAQAKMEDIKNMDYTDIQDSGPSGNSLLNGTTTVTVTERAEGKVVRVIVDWDKPGNGPPEDLVTLIRRP